MTNHIWRKTVDPYDHTLELSDDPKVALSMLRKRSPDLADSDEGSPIGCTKFYNHGLDQACEVEGCLGLHTLIIIDKQAIENLGRKDLLLRTIVHEVVHASQGILESTGIKDDSGEALAYLADYLFGYVRETLS